MSKPKSLPSVERLNEVFIYDPQTGILRWRKSRSGIRPDGIAGAPSQHGLTVYLDGQKYYVHRIIFKMLHGYDPIEVDHKNRIKRINTPDNIRNATRSLNEANKISYNGQKTKGVTQLPSSNYRAIITKDGKRYDLGVFPTEQEAAKAYKQKAIELFGEFARW